MLLLNKFEAIDLEKESKLPEDDVRVLREYQNAYCKSRHYVLKTIKFFEANPKEVIKYEGYSDYHSSSDEIRSCMTSLVRKYEYCYNACVSYFEKKYEISLSEIKFSSSKCPNGYEKAVNAAYTDVIDAIFSHLGNFDFTAKAESELITACRDCAKSDYDRHRLNFKEKVATYYVWSVDALFKAISHFEAGLTTKKLKCLEELSRWDCKGKTIVIPEGEKITSLEFHKVGSGAKVQFASENDMVTFSRTYIGMNVTGV